MWVCLHPPFGGRKTSNGKIWHEMTISKPMGVEEFLKRLAERFPQLCRYIRPSGEETFHQLLLLRAGEVLNESDQIQPDDRIEIMMPLTGG
jgi:hypothetical protein